MSILDDSLLEENDETEDDEIQKCRFYNDKNLNLLTLKFIDDCYHLIQFCYNLLQFATIRYKSSHYESLLSARYLDILMISS